MRKEKDYFIISLNSLYHYYQMFLWVMESTVPVINWFHFISLNTNSLNLNIIQVGLSGLGVTCSPRDPRFVGSNPAEVMNFFRM